MRKIINAFILCFIVLLCIAPSFSAFEMPDAIKVGLFYGSTAKAEYTVFAKGIKAASADGVLIGDDDSLEHITVKRDNLYHLTLTTAYGTIDEAWAAAEKLKQNGVLAFYVLADDGFFIYTEGCESMEAAEALGEKLTLFGADFSISAPDNKLIVAYAGNSPWIGSKNGLAVIPKTGNAQINGSEYRGYFEFYRDDKSDVAAVNVLGIEEYLKGVVPKEVSALWHSEALKAQAIVARTYAVTNMNKFKSYGFNVDSTTNSQVYGGVSAEKEASNKAVDETAGQLVVYNGEPAEVFFFSSSGGKTENSENVWGGAKIPYLVSVDDTYENPDEASYARWEIVLSPEAVAEKLRAKGIDLGEITDITIDEVSEAGRSLKTTIHGTTASQAFTYDKIRSALSLYSTCFTVSREGGFTPSASILSADGTVTSSVPCGLYALSADNLSVLGNSLTVLGEEYEKNYTASNGTGNFVISGKGWGHALGMSQWGAKGMADNGFTCDEIIKHYFTGTEVVSFR